MNDRYKQLQNWIHKDLGLEDYRLNPVSEDASFRRYYRLEYDGSTAIIMDAPPSHEDSRPFINIASRLRECGVNAPKIHKTDLDQGFLLLSDLGNVLYLDVLDSTNADSLYQNALTSLSKIQHGIDHDGLPSYTETQLLNEMELFREWLIQKHLNIKLTDVQQQTINTVFSMLIDNALEQPKVFVHLDYHSRNLMYCKADNPGILDFQDAVIGPFTYDLVSLLKDCYIKWPRQQVNSWALEYFNVNFHGAHDETRFTRWFDLMGVQRHLKASGIFARLYHRDGKAGYLAEIPRTLSYIVELEHDYPELTDLIKLIQAQILPFIKGTD